MSQKECNICAPLFDKKMHHTFMVCAGSAGIRNCGALCQTRRDFCQTCRNSANTPHFHGKRQYTAVLPSKCDAHSVRKAVHMAPCFQVPLTDVCCILFDAYWEKSGTYDAMFSSAADARLLHSFLCVLYVYIH